MDCKFFSQQSLPVVDCFNSSNTSFFCSHAWYENFLQHVLAQDQDWSAQFVVYEQNNTVQSVFPLKMITTDKGSASFESLTNYYSPFYQFNSKLAFFEYFKDVQLNWDTLILRPMSKQEVFKIVDILKKVRLEGLPFYCFANWYLEVNQRSFDEYFTGLSSRVKNTVTRKTKQFNRLDNSTIKIIYEEDKLNEGIKAFEKVYASSWKEGETYPAFISGLIKTAAKQGYLRLAVAYLNNDPIAAQLWIVADNTAYIYKLAYDEQYKKLSIGSILTATLMRHVIDIDKVECVDYLSGDDSYKKEWMSHRRERWGIMIFNRRSFRGCLKMINEFTRFYVKKYLCF